MRLYRWIALGALLALLAGVAARDAHALGDGWIEIPSTLVSSATTTYTGTIDGTYLSKFTTILTISGIAGSQTAELQLFFYDPAAAAWFAVVTSGTAHSTNGTKWACIGLPICAMGFVPSADRWAVGVPRQFRLGVVTTTGDDVTFTLSIVPAK